MRALAAAALALATGALIACGGDRDASVTFPIGAPVPLRVSRIRAGDNDTNVPGNVAVPAR